MEQPKRARDALVADIGGTNARFAVADLDTLELSNIRHFLCSEHSGLIEAASIFLDGLAIPPRCAAIAVAAPLYDDRIDLTNSHWCCTKAELRTQTGLEDLLLLNDFQALALSLPHLPEQSLMQIGGGEAVGKAPKVVLGPGTGLGVATLIWGGGDWIPVATEGGHISLAAQAAHEQEIRRRLATGRDHVSVETVLSGPGLAELYLALAEIAEVQAERIAPNEVINRGMAKSDPIAVKALDLFIAWLGAFAGDAALLSGARGGVYIGGGIAPRIAELLCAGAFRQAFEAKGRMRGYLEPIPVFLILAEFAALKGAGAGLRQSLRASG